MLARRAILHNCLVLGLLTTACGLFAAGILAAFHEREHDAPQLATETTQSPTAPYPLILQEGDGERRARRPLAANDGQAHRVPFTIKADEGNGNAQDFFVVTEIEPPGTVIPFHMHHNAEEILILEEGGATVTVGDKRAEAGPRSIVFIPRETWVSVEFTGTQPVHLYALFSRQGFELGLRGISVLEGQPVTPLSADQRAQLPGLAHATYWDTSKGPYPPGVAQSAPRSCSEATQSPASPHSLILQEGDGEHRVGRPPFSDFRFTIKVDGQNGNAEDFLAATELMAPGGNIPFHMHHNAEEILILEEGGATVTVGDKRAVAGPRSIVFIPRETWVSVAFTGMQPVHLYAVFSRQGFEQRVRATTVVEGQPATPLGPDDLARVRAAGHETFWDTSKGPYPPGVAHP